MILFVLPFRQFLVYCFCPQVIDLRLWKSHLSGVYNDFQLTTSVFRHQTMPIKNILRLKSYLLFDLKSQIFITVGQRPAVCNTLKTSA